MNLKKVVLIAAIFVSVVGLPLLLISTPMIDTYQEWIDRNPHTGFHRWLQFSSAQIAYKTVRPEVGARGFRRYLEHYGAQDSRHPIALFRYARCLEESRKRDAAREQYELFRVLYPQHALAPDAEEGIRRIRYLLPK